MTVTYLIHPATMTYLPGDYRSKMWYDKAQGGGFWYTHTAPDENIDAELQALGYKRMDYVSWSTARTLEEVEQELAQWQGEVERHNIKGRHTPQFWADRRYAVNRVEWLAELVGHLRDVTRLQLA